MNGVMCWGFPLLVTLALPADWPRWAVMWAVAFAIYACCKWNTWQNASVRGASASRQLGYLLAWPGLDANAFLAIEPPGTVKLPARSEWLFAAGKMALGAWLLMYGLHLVPSSLPYLRGWVGMVGIVMVLHFGVFHLLSCAWRTAGVDARPVMNWPLASVSVSEFWGRRWNTAFRDLTHRMLFRPLTKLCGAHRALWIGFVFSGLVHDWVITVPARGGYGGPSLFFILQPAAIFIERSTLGRLMGLGEGWRGWGFTVLVLLGPVYLLFPPAFVLDVVLPMLRDWGAV